MLGYNEFWRLYKHTTELHIKLCVCQIDKPCIVILAWISPLIIFFHCFFSQSICAAVAYFYSNYILLQWQLLIMVVVGFFGTITFFTVEWEAAAALAARGSDYSSIWCRCHIWSNIQEKHRHVYCEVMREGEKIKVLQRLRWRKLLLNHRQSNWMWNMRGKSANWKAFFSCFNQQSMVCVFLKIRC